uniref:Protein sleepless n=1 Tax=Cacopsylla melanoneura TaxID=428564 RepID=A0A8D8ZL98_9HEMI
MVYITPSTSLSILIAIATFKIGDALTCYECNSHNNTQCASEIPPDSLKKDCNEHTGGSKYTLCRKIMQTIEFEVNGLPPDTRIIRSCAWDDSSYKNKCYQRSGFGGRQEVCSCSTDLCNGSPNISPLFTIPLLAVTFLFSYCL